MNDERALHARVVLVAGLLTAIVIIVLAAGFYRVVSLKVDTPSELVAVATSTNSKSTLLATRGSLLDRRGRILAGSRIGYKLFIDPSLVEDPEQIALDIGEKLKLNPAEIERKILSRSDSRYVVVAELLEQWQVDEIKTSSYKSVGLE
ncbi:MAG: hypothetical protein QF444_06185, partial [Phycisphaerales bacterium]|nr:hypothetical protein [Phycisphaerales bacterium]